MSDIREISNPHDKITIDYSDKDAAIIAVLFIGRGLYGIDGDDGLPVFILGGSTEWIKDKYNMAPEVFFDSVSKERIAAALDTVACVGERTSMTDVEERAKEYANIIRQEATP